MVKKYNKLVRDRIPEIIESSGKSCSTEILSHEDYIRMIDRIRIYAPNSMLLTTQ